MISSLGLREVAGFYVLGGNNIRNEALVRESLGQPQSGGSLLGAYVHQWLPGKGKQRAWACWDRGRVVGVISTRPRYGPGVSEVNRLLLREDSKEACFALLDRLKTMGSELAVSKIFLRLSQDSPYAEVPQTAGFSRYVTEQLYILKPTGNYKVDSTDSFSPRLREKGDERSLFQLYNACVPASVRQSEGITFEEWQQCREKSSAGTLEYLWIKGDSCVGWLRSGVCRGVGQLELMVHPEAEAALENMLGVGLAYLSRCPAIFCLSAEYQNSLHQLLRQHGFHQAAEYRLMLRLLAVPVSQPFVVPVQA